MLFAEREGTAKQEKFGIYPQSYQTGNRKCKSQRPGMDRNRKRNKGNQKGGVCDIWGAKAWPKNPQSGG